MYSYCLRWHAIYPIRARGAAIKSMAADASELLINVDMPLFPLFPIKKQPYW